MPGGREHEHKVQLRVARLPAAACEANRPSQLSTVPDIHVPHALVPPRVPEAADRRGVLDAAVEGRPILLLVNRF